MTARPHSSSIVASSSDSVEATKVLQDTVAQGSVTDSAAAQHSDQTQSPAVAESQPQDTNAESAAIFAAAAVISENFEEGHGKSDPLPTVKEEGNKEGDKYVMELITPDRVRELIELCLATKESCGLIRFLKKTLSSPACVSASFTLPPLTRERISGEGNRQQPSS